MIEWSNLGSSDAAVICNRHVPVTHRVTSMRLAYKELEIDRKMEEKKLKNMEGKKKEQAERLGMGFGNRR